MRTMLETEPIWIKPIWIKSIRTNAKYSHWLTFGRSHDKIVASSADILRSISAAVNSFSIALNH